jgi:glyoxylate reductase
MGRIGRVVAKRAKAFGMEIHYYNRSKLNKDLEAGAIYHDNIQSLFSTSDILSINCPETKETTKIINKKTLKFFSREAIIVNSARGSMIDDDSMVQALKSKKIFALGLDVYNGEPNIHPGYLKLQNVFILPHLGSATKKTRIDMGNLAIDNIEEFFKTGKCINKVN